MSDNTDDDIRRKMRELGASDEVITRAMSDDAAPGFMAGKLKTRRWIYNVAIAVLAIVAGWQGFQAVTMEQWTDLLTAILALGGAGASGVARANVR